MNEEIVKLNVILPTLERGDVGNYVISLQALLYGRGFNIGRYGIDGGFGKSTEKAVRSCQSFYGITVDGIVGKDTWSVLLSGDRKCLI